MGEPIDGKGPLLQGTFPVPFARAAQHLISSAAAVSSSVFSCRCRSWRNVDADVTMVGLVGERRRQLQEFLARMIRARKIWRRGSGRDLRADKAPGGTCEYFRDENNNVVVPDDSVTRA
jgi:flagellum-specific ATP synthase